MSAPDATGRPRFLADEDFEPAIIKGLRRRQPQLDLMTAVEAGNLGKTDSTVIAFAAEENRILVSHDKRTLPATSRIIWLLDIIVLVSSSSPGRFP